ncbi:MAG: DUF305 domain-containing protein [Ilumatobacteraceae bacterium]
MRITNRPAVVTIGSVMVAGALVLTACGGGDDAASDATRSTVPAEASTAATDVDQADVNASDVMFAQGMIPHHSQAVELAALALVPEREASPDVRDLAQRVQAGQDPEIEQMTDWLTSWDQPIDVPAMDDMDMDGMVATAQIDALATLSGSEFDAEWSRLMIAHHEGAIAMAKTEVTDGLNRDAISLAQDIIAAQQAEIEELS